MSQKGQWCIRFKDHGQSSLQVPKLGVTRRQGVTCFWELVIRWPPGVPFWPSCTKAYERFRWFSNSDTCEIKLLRPFGLKFRSRVGNKVLHRPNLESVACGIDMLQDMGKRFHLRRTLKAEHRLWKFCWCELHVLALSHLEPRGHCQSLLVRSSQKPTWNPKMDSVWRNLHIYMFTGIVLIYIYIKHICTTCRSKTYPVEVHYARMLRKPKVNSERAAALPKRGHRMTKTHPAHMVSCELRVWVELFQRV